MSRPSSLSFFLTLIFVAVLIFFAMLERASAQNTFIIPPEARGAYSSMLPVFPTYVDARVLAAAANETHTVPTGAKHVVFSANCAAFYAKAGGAAAVPAADVTDGTGSALNPAGFGIDGVATIGVISPTACIVTMWFYK